MRVGAGYSGLGRNAAAGIPGRQVMFGVSRRRFSLLLALGCGLVGAPRAGRTAARDRLKALLEATLSDPAGARAIGRRVLAASPDAAADARALAARLLAERPVSTGDLRRILARLRQDDLSSGAFVLVDGWILPRLEARVCALTILL